MIKFTTGDILKADTEALVNTVNCVGVMGRGIALQFKNAYPENYEVYQKACAENDLQPGQMLVVATGRPTGPGFIINFPTKRHWRGKSRMEDIESGLRALATELQNRAIRSVAVPPLGSGLGGLPWLKVRALIEQSLGQLEGIDVLVYQPKPGPAEWQHTRSTEVPKMTPGRAALVILMERYLAGLLDPFVSLLEVHKLMYFLQEAGQTLQLRFARAPYGPYSENLRHVLRAVEGHFVSGYSDGGDAPDKQLTIVPGAVEDATGFVESDIETKARIDRVAGLIAGYESSFGLELLSTIHWVATRDGAKSAADSVRLVHAWSPRKRQFTERQIVLAYRALADKKWLPAPP